MPVSILLNMILFFSLLFFSGASSSFPSVSGTHSIQFIHFDPYVLMIPFITFGWHLFLFRKKKKNPINAGSYFDHHSILSNKHSIEWIFFWIWFAWDEVARSNCYYYYSRCNNMILMTIFGNCIARNCGQQRKRKLHILQHTICTMHQNYTY